MPKSIIWSTLSVADIENTLDYLHLAWNGQIEFAFLDSIESLIVQISNNPKQFPIVNKKNKVRKCVLTKYNTIFYRETKNRIEILRVFDTRQDPKKLKNK
jgi:plasmid stabilization system protein ParE